MIMMKAIVQDKYGSPDDFLQLQEIDKPVVGDDEVPVRVRAASVHPDVWHVVIGRLYVLRLMGAGLLKPKNPLQGDWGHIAEIPPNILNCAALLLPWILNLLYLLTRRLYFKKNF
jgi:hypothetical protein